jgi:hypothetical protein
MFIGKMDKTNIGYLLSIGTRLIPTWGTKTREEKNSKYVKVFWYRR